MRIVLFSLSVLLAACDDFTQVSNSGFGAFEPALAVAGDNIVAVWNGDRHGNDEIYLRVLDATLKPLSDELRLTTSNEASYEADVAILNGNPVITWYAKNAAGQLQVKLGMWDMQGHALWQREINGSARNGRVPLLEAVGDRLFIAWLEEDLLVAQSADMPAAQQSPALIYGAWLDAKGDYLVQPFKIAEASRTTWNLNAAALFDGRIALVFDAAVDTTANELWLSVIDAATAHTTMLSDDDGFASKYPDIAASAQGTALTWFDNKDGNEEVYLALIDVPALLTRNAELASAATRITFTAGNSIGAYLAWNANTLGLAWNDNDPGQHDIFFQRFDPNGKALEKPRRLTKSSASSLIPAIVPFNAGFMLGWNEVMLGGNHSEGSAATRAEIVLRYVE